MTDITELTAEKLEEIRQRYCPVEVPRCLICGDEMTVQRMSASRITYGCTGAIHDNTGCHYAEGRSIADDHYAESRITIVDVSDPDVLALTEALEESRAQITRQEDFIREQDQLIAALKRNLQTALQRTVTVKLPQRYSMLFREGFSEDYRTEVTYREEDIQEMLTAAGIKVEADSVGSDVGDRNQPGMVVAVHIDVGDFVKFSGKVYEVEETDFDDHDVTLWFVGGETLKCAAGCQIEVVSVPEETE